MRRFFAETLPNICKKCVNFFKKHTFLRCCLLALVTLFLSEALSRHSLFAPFKFLLSTPFVFLFNYLIILATFSLAMLFPKESFALVIISSFWLIISIVNYILLSFRATPFSAIDFSLAITMLRIINVYLSFFELLLIVIGSIIFIIALVLIWKKTTKVKVNFVQSGLFVVSILLILLLSGLIGKHTGLLNKKFPNLAQAYDEYGFAYGFSLSVFDIGIDEPDHYTDENLENILKEINYSQNTPPKNSPNIIIVQLESFFDVNRLSYLITDENPIPTFSQLKSNYPHGLITVPSLGGGTANVEFEILTGMNLEHFGPGEYPYKTILRAQTCETPAFTLKNYGYTSHAIHNHTATFYDRHYVYSALGFDTFTPIELMSNIEYTPLGWAKDTILTEEIINCLNSTENQDFIFTVTVQPHGKYPDESLPSEKEIMVDLENISDQQKEAQYKYFVEQLNGTDKFISELIQSLSALEEPTAVLFYGDHFPAIYIDEDKLKEGTKYQTDYVIWANYDIEQDNKNLYAYQLVAHFFKALECNLGTTTKIHQNLLNELNYQDKLELVEYDMLYGNKVIYDGVSPYKKTDIKYGISDIYITKLEFNNSTLTIHGNKFNEFTKVKIDNYFKDTVYVNDKCIKIENVSPDNAKTLQLFQYTQDKFELKSSAEYLISSFINP